MQNVQSSWLKIQSLEIDWKFKIGNFDRPILHLNESGNKISIKNAIQADTTIRGVA